MLAGQRLAVHFVAQHRLRMQSRLHVKRLVIIVGALHVNEAGRRIGANHLQEIGKTHATEVADYVPTFHANVSRVLVELRQSLNHGK